MNNRRRRARSDGNQAKSFLRFQFNYEMQISSSISNAKTMIDSQEPGFKGGTIFNSLREGKDESTMRITKDPTTACRSAMVVHKAIAIELPASKRRRFPRIKINISFSHTKRVKEGFLQHAIHNPVNLILDLGDGRLGGMLFVGKNPIIAIPPD